MSILLVVIGGFMWALRSPTAKGALIAGLVTGIALATLRVLEQGPGDTSPWLLYVSSLLGSVPVLWSVHSCEGIGSRLLLIAIGGLVLIFGGPILVVQLWTH